jgi:hypothetical protein
MTILYKSKPYESDKADYYRDYPILTIEPRYKETHIPFYYTVDTLSLSLISPGYLSRRG